MVVEHASVAVFAVMVFVFIDVVKVVMDFPYLQRFRNP